MLNFYNYFSIKKLKMITFFFASKFLSLFINIIIVRLFLITSSQASKIKSLIIIILNLFHIFKAAMFFQKRKSRLISFNYYSIFDRIKSLIKKLLHNIKNNHNIMKNNSYNQVIMIIN